MRFAYYNENDPYAAQWIRNLVKAGYIPDGEIDERSIVDVQPDDLRGFRQVHLFCGIAGWPLALKIARWPEDKEVWTGSCPCQPFSGAGKRKGTSDERHLWPHMARLILARRPAVVMGEQVDKQAGYDWLDGVRSDLEAEAFEVRGVDIPAASVNSPHKRNRIVWIARRLSDALGVGSRSRLCEEGSIIDGDGAASIGRGDGRLSDTEHTSRCAEHEQDAGERQDSGARDRTVPWEGGRADESDSFQDASGSGQRTRSLSRDGAAGSQSGDTQLGERGSAVEQLGFAFSAGSQGHTWDGDNSGESGWIGEGQDGSTAEASGGNRVCLADTGGGLVSKPRRGSEGRDGVGPGGTVSGRGGSHGSYRQSPRTDAGSFWDDYVIVGPDPKGKYRRVGRSLPGIEKVIEGRALPNVCFMVDGISKGVAGVRTGEEGAAEIQTEGWGTPRVTNNGGIPSPEVTGRGSRLEDQAAELHGWSSPTSLSFADSHQPGNSRNMNAIRDVALSLGSGDHIPLLGVAIPARVGKLKGFGNAIVPGMCAEVIMAFMESEAMAEQWGDCGS